MTTKTENLVERARLTEPDLIRMTRHRMIDGVMDFYQDLGEVIDAQLAKALWAVVAEVTCLERDYGHRLRDSESGSEDEFQYAIVQQTMWSLLRRWTQELDAAGIKRP